ncbi:hypothetical protein EV189_3424 [Motilibacter rhizosphaerae]|uniref:Uncharacterized protein n=1 Tax=Motilibacter rhizosphaerae TaxID=598652 RepID=A0A4Q7NAQ9_9ACTN|nr:hypothetical protein EV189_3424 [Motilibacter rhizosphaerae]
MLRWTLGLAVESGVMAEHQHLPRLPQLPPEDQPPAPCPLPQGWAALARAAGRPTDAPAGWWRA